MPKLILSLFILLTSTIGLSQDDTDKKQKTNARANSRVVAKQQIQEMHTGVLLVRLKTRQKSIAALRSSGRDKKADKIERKQAKFNVDIVKGFKENFDFCPTYFFYSHHSQAVLDGEFDSVEFLNDSLQYDSTITINNTSIYTAEFGLIEQDTAQYQNGYEYVPGEDGLEKQTQYNGGANMSFEALIIKNDQFIQLRKPFPYYSRTLGSVPLKRKPKLVIGQMNAQLHRFL